MLMEINLISGSLGELNTVLLVINFKYGNAHFSSLLLSVLSLGGYSKLHFVMFFVHFGINIIFFLKMLTNGFLNEIWIAGTEESITGGEYL